MQRHRAQHLLVYIAQTWPLRPQRRLWSRREKAKLKVCCSHRVSAEFQQPLCFTMDYFRCLYWMFEGVAGDTGRSQSSVLLVVDIWISCFRAASEDCFHHWLIWRRFSQCFKCPKTMKNGFTRQLFLLLDWHLPKVTILCHFKAKKTGPVTYSQLLIYYF